LIRNSKTFAKQPKWVVNTKDCFALFFSNIKIIPTIPQKDCSLNIIEKENGTKNDFNYYDVSLKMADGLEVM
jgi:hypothetical protein